MIRSPRWSPLAALLATVAIVFAACAGTTPSTAPSTAASAPPSAAASSGPFTAMAYPETGEAPCGQAAAPDATHSQYAGRFKKISAPDARTVVFDLCNPDVAFLSKIAFTSFAINDAAWLDRQHRPGGHDPEDRHRGQWHRPLQAERVEPRPGRDLRRLRRLLGRKGHDREGHPPLEQGGGTAARRAPGRAPSTASTTSDRPTSRPSRATRASSSSPATGLNVFYLGFNNTFAPFDNEAVRQAIAKGIDRQRIVDNFYPGGSEVADYFTPCDIANGCVGTQWYDFDAAAAKSELTAAGFRASARPTSSTSGRPSAATCRIRRSSRPRSRRSSRPTWASPSSSTSRTTRPTWTTRPTACSTASTCWAGVPTIPTRRTSSTITSGPAPRSSSATSSTTSPPRSTKAQRAPATLRVSPPTRRPTSSSSSTSR